ncbi:MAG: hypothetical protein H6574_23270 [Lewinellaceae bacterium]|nr:hypothetical protein [Saprospiraceae bacterium]MCB9333985.1 hypothetical protein [Lewinellaceae bacterium]
MKKIATLILLALCTQVQLAAQCNPDTEPPMVAAAQGLTITWLPNCFIILFATDFLDTLSDNCTPGDQIEFAIRKTETGTGFPTNPDGSPQLYVQYEACDQGANYVEVWARDQAGNTSVDTALLYVWDYGGFCDCFSGKIRACASTVNNEPVEEVSYELCLNLPVLPVSCFFRTGNCELFSGIYFGTHPVITPTKNNDPLNGVSTFDLVLINKHILGTQPFDNPYQLIAADANNSGSVSTFDIVELRKLILGNYTTLPNNTSWRFLPKGYTFPNPANPFSQAIPDSIGINDFFAWETQVDFTGIKIGDISGNAIPDSLISLDDRSESLLQLEDHFLQPGQTTRIPLHFSEITKLLGLQFALGFDPLALEISGLDLSERLTRSQPLTTGFTAGRFFAQPQPGLLTFSWDDANTTTLSAGEPILFLEIKARQALQLSQAFHLKSERLHPELYTADGTIHSMALDFLAAPKIEQTRVFPAAPNPVSGPVSIPVALVEPGNLMLEIFDLNGRQLHRQEVFLGTGLHRIEIPVEVLAGNRGVLPYRVVVGDLIELGKLICP